MAEVFFIYAMIQLKGYYTEYPAWTQLFILLLLVLAGAFLSSFLGLGIFFLSHGFSANIFQYPGMLRLNQLLSATGTFILPSLGMAWLCSQRPRAYLSLGKAPTPYALLLTLVCLLAVSPMITLTDLWNQQLTLPGFLKPLEGWMRQQEDAAKQLTDIFLANRSFLSVVSNLLLIGVIAGVGEELFFRGAVQRVLGKWTANHHVVIWAAAILFSAFHIQFYGFIPRMLLGAFFGYLLYWSGNIWLPVFAHTINNALAVITLSSTRLSQNAYLTGELTPQQLLPYSFFAAAAFMLFLFMIRVLRRYLQAVKR